MKEQILDHRGRVLDEVSAALVAQHKAAEINYELSMFATELALAHVDAVLQVGRAVNDLDIRRDDRRQVKGVISQITRAYLDDAQETRDHTRELFQLSGALVDKAAKHYQKNQAAYEQAAMRDAARHGYKNSFGIHGPTKKPK